MTTTVVIEYRLAGADANPYLVVHRGAAGADAASVAILAPGVNAFRRLRKT